MKKTLFFVAFLLSAAFVQAQKAEEVVQKHLAAIGAANWTGVNSVKMEAKISSDAAAGMVILWNSTIVRDKAARMDVSVMGMTQSTAISADKGWSTNPFMGQNDPEPMTADQIESMKDMLDIDGTLVGYKEKGYTLEYVGRIRRVELNPPGPVHLKVEPATEEVPVSKPVGLLQVSTGAVAEAVGVWFSTVTVVASLRVQPLCVRVTVRV